MIKKLNWSHILSAFLCLAMVVEGNDGIAVYTPFDGLRGKLVYLEGRFPKKGERDLPPAVIWSYDLETHIKSRLFEVEKAGELIASADGNWIGVVFQDCGKILVVSQTNDYRKTFTYSAFEELQAVIVGARLCVKFGPRGQQRIDVIELETQISIPVSLEDSQAMGPGKNDTTTMEFAFVSSRISDSNNVFITCGSIGDRLGRPDGLYMYNLEAERAERVGQFTEMCDYSYAGECVRWEQVFCGWAIKTYPASGEAGISEGSAGRVVCRFYGGGYNLLQVSPCLRYALVEQRAVSENGMESTYYICDLATGKKKLFVEAKPSNDTRGLFIGSIRWVKDPY